jgi:hypothetical protein
LVEESSGLGRRRVGCDLTKSDLEIKPIDVEAAGRLSRHVRTLGAQQFLQSYFAKPLPAPSLRLIRRRRSRTAMSATKPTNSAFQWPADINAKGLSSETQFIQPLRIFSSEGEFGVERTSCGSLGVGEDRSTEGCGDVDTRGSATEAIDSLGSLASMRLRHVVGSEPSGDRRSYSSIRRARSTRPEHRRFRMGRGWKLKTSWSTLKFDLEANGSDIVGVRYRLFPFRPFSAAGPPSTIAQRCGFVYGKRHLSTRDSIAERAPLAMTPIAPRRATPAKISADL